MALTSKIAAWLIEHIQDWGWAVVGWFSPQQQRLRRIHRLITRVGRLSSRLMKSPMNPDYESLLRDAKTFGEEAADFYNSDTHAAIYVPMPLEIALPPPEARHNTKEGREALGFWLSWHRQQLMIRRGQR